MTSFNRPSLMRPILLPYSVSSPVVTPLSPSLVYASDSPDTLDAQYNGDLNGYTYAREGHPNADVLAGHLDRLEAAEVVWSQGRAWLRSRRF
jgi:cystathionine beta-lyase/cystathionine gamma-synthase